MGLYLFRNPNTGKVVEIFQRMNDEHKYTDSAGVKYDRVFVSPQTAIDTKVDPWSESDWMKRTNKNITVGDMMDESRNLSEKRAGLNGVDPVKQKLFDNYQKRTGKRHPEDRPKRIETDRVIIET